MKGNNMRRKTHFNYFIADLL